MASITNILDLASGNWTTSMLHAVCTMGIADQLEGRMDVDTLAQRTGTHAPSLYRLLRALASQGIFEEVDERVFTHTKMSTLLRVDSPSCVRAFCIMRGSRYQYLSWANLPYALRTGKSAMTETMGCTMFEYLASSPEERKVFQEAMACITRNVGQELARNHRDLFPQGSKVVDVGGGHGELLSTLKEGSSFDATVFDLPNVVMGIEKEGISFVGGSFFEPLPVGGDIFILKYILHDWSDEKCILLLRNITDAMKEDSKLYILESMLPGGNEPSYHKILDMQMLVCLDDGARERTREEYEDLLDRSGLVLRSERLLETLQLSLLVVEKK